MTDAKKKALFALLKTCRRALHNCGRLEAKNSPEPKDIRCEWCDGIDAVLKEFHINPENL